MAGAVPRVRLVHSTRLAKLPGGPERHLAHLAELGVDALNLRAPDWSGGLAAMVHRFDILALGWDAQLHRVLDELLDSGLDAVYSDHVDRMMAAIHRLPPPEG